MREADFQAVLVGLARPLPEPGSQEWMEADRPLPVDKGSRLLAAHAAWKKSLSEYAEAALTVDPGYAGSPATFLKGAMDDVAWYSSLRGVGMLVVEPTGETEQQ